MLVPRLDQCLVMFHVRFMLFFVLRRYYVQVIDTVRLLLVYWLINFMLRCFVLIWQGYVSVTVTLVLRLGLCQGQFNVGITLVLGLGQCQVQVDVLVRVRLVLGLNCFQCQNSDQVSFVLARLVIRLCFSYCQVSFRLVFVSGY